MRLLFLMCTLYCGGLNAQTSILYQSSTLSVKNNREFIFYTRLVVKDTLSYYFPRKVTEKHTHRKQFGKKAGSHSFYYLKSSNMLFRGYSYDEFKNSFLSYADNRHTWKLTSMEKTIAGFKCKSAIFVHKNQDTTFAMYAPELLHAYGPDHYVGLPGTVLEVIDQKSNYHTIATSIEQGDFTVVLPRRAEIISKEALAQKVKKSRNYIRII